MRERCFDQGDRDIITPSLEIFRGISNTHTHTHTQNNPNKDLGSNEKCIRENTKWMKILLIKYSVQRYCKTKTTKLLNNRKFTKLNAEKQVKTSFAENPGKFSANLSGYKSPSKEIKILKPGLRNGVTTRPLKSEMIVISEDI